MITTKKIIEIPMTVYSGRNDEYKDNIVVGPERIIVNFVNGGAEIRVEAAYDDICCYGSQIGENILTWLKSGFKGHYASIIHVTSDIKNSRGAMNTHYYVIIKPDAVAIKKLEKLNGHVDRRWHGNGGWVTCKIRNEDKDEDYDDYNEEDEEDED